VYSTRECIGKGLSAGDEGSIQGEMERRIEGVLLKTFMTDDRMI
jgi:hypothetical protein